MNDAVRICDPEMETIISIGEPALLEQLAEECAELAQAALKLARLKRGENPTPKSKDECEEELLEETVDVNICMGVLSYAGALDLSRSYIIECQKYERWAKRIKASRKIEEHEDE